MFLLMVIFIVLVSFLAGYLLSRLTSQYKFDLAAHEQKEKDLARRIEELEKSGKKNGNPQRTDIGLEDAIAVVMDAKQKKEDATLHFEQHMDYLDVRLGSALGILQQLRRNPNGYDEDRPNGKREVIK